MKVLVTGGLGYIGSHTCVQLIENGHTPVVMDNLSNSKALVLNRIEALTGQRPSFHLGDVRDEAFLDSIFAQHQIDAVIHFAGLKAVGESVAKPLEYYDNNVNGSLVLARSMRKAGVKNIILAHLLPCMATHNKYPLPKTLQPELPQTLTAAANILLNNA